MNRKRLDKEIERLLKCNKDLTADKATLENDIRDAEAKLKAAREPIPRVERQLREIESLIDITGDEERYSEELHRVRATLKDLNQLADKHSLKVDLLKEKLIGIDPRTADNVNLIKVLEFYKADLELSELILGSLFKKLTGKQRERVQELHQTVEGFRNDGGTAYLLKRLVWERLKPKSSFMYLGK
jgi:chromosome segregation ATPase